MGTVTFRVRSIVWFVTGAVLAAAVTVMFLSAWRVDAAPGDTDATFVPITPCRLADTRPEPNRVGTIGALGVADTDTFSAHGADGECTIPTDAVAVSMNVTARGATVQSFLTFWPDGTQPLAASLNPAPGEPPTPNAVTVDLSDAGAFNVYNDKGTVNVVRDINGYYIASSLKDLAARLAAVETAQAVGVDPAVLARIDAVEASAAINASDIDDVGAIAVGNLSDLAYLLAARPFAKVATATDFEALTTTPTSYLDVEITAPVDGQVTVNYSTYITNFTGGQESICNVYPSTLIPADFIDSSSVGVGFWETAVENDGDQGSVSGTNGFAITAGQTITYSLACEESGGTGFVDGRAMTAIFTPAP